MLEIYIYLILSYVTKLNALCCARKATIVMIIIIVIIIIIIIIIINRVKADVSVS